MILLEPLTQRDKSPAEGEEAYPQCDVRNVHSVSPHACHRSGLNVSKMDIKKVFRLRARTSRLCKNYSLLAHASRQTRGLLFLASRGVTELLGYYSQR